LPRSRSSAAAPRDVAREPEDSRSLFLRGVTINVLNPKAAVFYVAILPSFIDAQRGALLAQKI
jgi:threonine/homoserine/homoserine lactone efflux protein